MDFALTPEQALIKESVERFVADECAPEQQAAIANSAEGFSRAHWASFGDLGWLGLLADAEHGGFGGGAIETMIVMEAFGAGLVAEPFVPSVVMAGTMLTAGRSEYCAQLLAQSIVGEQIFSVAYAEPQSGYDASIVETVARRDGSDFIIEGQKIACPYGASAGMLLVSVRTSEATPANAGISLVAIDAEAGGMERRDYVTYDERRASDIRFNGVRVPREALVGDVNGGLPLLEAARDRATAAICAEAIGAMGVLQRGTVDYLKTRVQFGRSIGTFQALQHRAVDMLIQLELGRAIATYAAAAVDADDAADRRKAVAAAKVHIADAGRFIGESAIQLHGAIGFTEELFVGRYVKRLTVIERELGDAAFSLQRYMES